VTWNRPVGPRISPPLIPSAATTATPRLLPILRRPVATRVARLRSPLVRILPPARNNARASGSRVDNTRETGQNLSQTAELVGRSCASDHQPGDDGPMTRCPRCGGQELKAITPSEFECVARIVTGHLPPGARGPRPLPITEPCGWRFQISTEGRLSGLACSCGRDSIGACVDRHTRLCGLHGSRDGTFLCARCSELRQDVERRTEDEARRAEAAAQEVARTIRVRQTCDLLSAAADLSSLRDVVDAHWQYVDEEALHERWTHLAGANPFEGTHTLHEVKFDRSLARSRRDGQPRPTRRTLRAWAMYNTQYGMLECFIDEHGQRWETEFINGLLRYRDAPAPPGDRHLYALRSGQPLQFAFERSPTYVPSMYTKPGPKHWQVRGAQAVIADRTHSLSQAIRLRAQY